MYDESRWPRHEQPREGRWAEELDAVRLALDGRDLSGKSELIAEYEAALADAFDAEFVVAVSSGSAALHAAVRAFCHSGTGGVVVPPIAPIPSILPILAAGCVPVFADVLPDRLGFTPIDWDKLFTERQVVAVMPVSLWGYPFQLDTAMLAAARAADVGIIEDDAHAHGARSAGKPVGKQATVRCFSTNAKKTLSTGEGGFVLTDDPEIASRIRSFARLGDLSGKRSGLNYQLTSLAAAVGLARLPQVGGIVARRRTKAAALARELADRGIRTLSYSDTEEPAFYSLCFQTDSHGRHVTERLADLGLIDDFRAYNWRPAYEHDLFAAHRTPCPVAERFAEETHQLSVGDELPVDAVSAVADLVHQAVTEVRADGRKPAAS